MGKDYLAAILEEPTDLEHSGVKGMKWGVRRSRTDRKLARHKTATEIVDRVGKIVADNKPSSAKPHGNIQDHVESSAARYDRLKAQAKSGDAKSMTDQDLKFFNARTEALAKINKMNEAQAGWLSTTTKKVVQTAAQKAMQDIANGITDKYVSAPILKGVGAEPKKKAKKKEPLALPAPNK